MKKLLSILLILFLGSSIAVSQDLSKKDSLALVVAVEAVFKCADNPDLICFEEISTLKLSYIFSLEDGVLHRKQFFKEHFIVLKDVEEWGKARESKLFFVQQESNPIVDVIVSFVSEQNLDYLEAHGKSELTLYFKKINDKFKFSGIELIP